MYKNKKCQRCGKEIGYWTPALKYCNSCARITRREQIYNSIYRKIAKEKGGINNA